MEEDIKILERFKNNEMQRDKLERDNRCGGWKIGDIYKHFELNIAIEHLLSDYTRQKQINEEHQKINGELTEKVKELEKENAKLKTARVENDYGYENIHFITKNDLVSIDTNKYLIEIEENKFVDLKQVYLDNKNSIPKQKIKDLMKKEKLPLTIVGGRRNGKTLEYGKKLGRIEICQELLGEE